MNGTDFSVLFLEYLGLAVLIIAVLIAFLIMCITATFKLFEKLALRPWLGLVPILNLYFLFSKTKTRRYYIPYLVVTFAALVLGGLILAYPSPSPYLLIAVSPAALSLLLIRFKMYRRLALGFERSAFFGILLTLLPFVFVPTLAFSGDQYFEKM